jgi:peptidoglycan/LPS O-acetylase OafA/YrhL
MGLRRRARMIRLVVPPFLIGAVLIVGLVALWPTRRLYVAGRSASSIALYFAAVFLLGLLVALAPRVARLVLPLLVVLYIVPFINWRAGIERLLGRRPREVRPPMKDVTPRDEAGKAR